MARHIEGYKMMKPKKFKKVYLITVFSLMLFFLFFTIVGVIALLEMDNRQTLGIIFISIGILSLLFEVIAIIRGRKRFMQIDKEIYEERLTEPIESHNPMHVYWSYHEQNQEVDKGYQINIYEDKIVLENNQTILLSQIKYQEVVEHEDVWYIALSETPYGSSEWTGLLVVGNDYMESILNRVLKEPIDASKLRALQAEHETFVKSQTTFGKNYKLIVQIILFYVVMVTLTLGTGVFLSLRVMGQSAAIAVTIFVFFPLTSFLHAKLFKNTHTFKYVIHNQGLGYMSGRMSLYLPFIAIYKIEVYKDVIWIQASMIGPDEEVYAEQLDLDYHERLLEHLRKHQDNYAYTIEDKRNMA